MLHQIFVKGVIGLQPNNECGCSNIIATVINHSHMVLEITDIAFDGIFWLHLDGEEVVATLLKLLSRGILIEEGITNLLEASEKS